MPVSKPMQLMTLRIAESDKVRLEELARERNVTLSYALREGARLYLEDARDLAGRKTGRHATSAT